MERLRPLAHSIVWVLAIEEVHLLKTTTVGLYTVKTAHTDNGWGYLKKLIYAWLILSRTLPHIAEY